MNETLTPTDYTPEQLLSNLAAWNKALRRLKFQRLVLDKRAADLREQKKALEKSFSELYATLPEDGVAEDASLFDGLEDDSAAGPLSVTFGLESGAMDAAHLFGLVRQRFDSAEKLREYLGDFLDTGAAFFTSEAGGGA